MYGTPSVGAAIATLATMRESTLKLLHERQPPDRDFPRYGCDGCDECECKNTSDTETRSLLPRRDRDDYVKVIL